MIYSFLVVYMAPKLRIQSQMLNYRDERMGIKYADFLSASNIYNEVLKEIQIEQKETEQPARSIYNKILKNCNRLIVERFADPERQDRIRLYIAKILLPIYKIDNKQNHKKVPVN